MTKELARLTGQPLERVKRDLRRDFYLAGIEAVSYGVIDEVLKPHDVRELTVCSAILRAQHQIRIDCCEMKEEF